MSGDGTTYEDAADGSTKGWDIYDTSPGGASIKNVYDSDRQSRVIQLSGSGTENGYRLRSDGGANMGKFRPVHHSMEHEIF